MIRTNSLLILLEKSNIPKSHDFFLTYLCRRLGNVCSYSLFVFTMVSCVIPKNTALQAPLQTILLLEIHSSWLTSLSLSPCPKVTNHNSLSHVGESAMLSVMFKLQSCLHEKFSQVLLIYPKPAFLDFVLSFCVEVSQNPTTEMGGYSPQKSSSLSCLESKVKRWLTQFCSFFTVFKSVNPHLPLFSTSSLFIHAFCCPVLAALWAPGLLPCWPSPADAAVTGSYPGKGEPLSTGQACFRLCQLWPLCPLFLWFASFYPIDVYVLVYH